MPINLDSCITGIFVPGNIGASSGQPPVVRLMPPRAPGVVAAAVAEVATAVDRPSTPTILTSAIAEVATATDTPTAQSVNIAAVAEVATATDAPDATSVAGLVPRSAMLLGVFVNSDGTLREAYVDGTMVNL